MCVTWARAGAIAGAWGNPPRPSRQLRAKSGATPSLSEATETPWFVQCKSSACLPDLSLAHTASKAAGLALGGPGGQGGEAAGPSGVRTQAHLLFAWLHCGRLKVSRGQWLSDVRGRERSLLRRLGRSDRTCCLTGRSEPHRHQVNLPASGQHHEAAPHAAGCPAPGYDAGEAYWRKVSRLPPLCCQNSDCNSSELRDKGWHRNAHSCKGNGMVHTVYVASKRRQCM